MFTTPNGIVVIGRDELQIKGSRTSGTVRSTCPSCRDSKTHGNEPCVSINLDTGWGKCFKCGTIFILKNKYDDYRHIRYGDKNKYNGPNLRRLMDDYPMEVMAYLRKRCISARIAHDMGVRCMRAKDPKDGKDKTWLSFQYMDGKQCVNIQHKSLDKSFLFEKNCEVIPYNINSIIGHTHFFVTEGLMDALAMKECGYDAISVPNGAGTDLHKFDRFRQIFDSMETIYYAGDTDDTGYKFRDSVLHYFGEARCKVVEWEYRDPEHPENDFHAKDANEMLMERGKEAVKQCIDRAWTPNIKGVVTLEDIEHELDEYFRHGIPDGVSINLQGYGHLVKYKLGCLYIYTAYPGQGKSTFVDYVVLQLLSMMGWKTAIFSPEKYPVSQHYHELITTITGKSCDCEHLSEPAFRRAKKSVMNNIFEISGEGDNKIENILHVAEQLVLRHQIRQLVLDPFNYIELPTIPGANDTQKISEVLKAIITFAHRYQVLVHLVAHPRKPSYEMGKQQHPTLSDINGSQDFANKADVGVVIQRGKATCELNGRQEERDVTFIYNEKTRHSQLGQLGTIAVTYDKANHRFFGCTERRVYGINGKESVIYTPIDHNNDDWLAGDAEQQQLHFDEEDGSGGDTNDGMPFRGGSAGEDDLPF